MIYVCSCNIQHHWFRQWHAGCLTLDNKYLPTPNSISTTWYQAILNQNTNIPFEQMWLKIASSQIILNPDLNQLIFVDLHITLHLFTNATMDNQSQYLENWCIMSQISNVITWWNMIKYCTEHESGIRNQESGNLYFQHNKNIWTS